MANENVTKDLQNADPETLAGEILNILYAKKAHDLKLLHVTDQTILADYFIIATGNSNTQIKSLADDLEYRTGLRGMKPKSVEGFREATWILLDYSSVIVHIFNRETREFYNLEKLWGDSEDVDPAKYIRTDTVQSEEKSDE